MSNTNSIISKVWSFCDILRDDGVGYGDYLEQLTYLLFLKMADEYSKPPYNRDTGIPTDYNWESLNTLKGAELETHYIASTRRMALMNMFLHNIGDLNSGSMISDTDALIASPETSFDYVLANLPFGKKGSLSFTTTVEKLKEKDSQNSPRKATEKAKENRAYNRQDFWATTSNKQLNFVQHICAMLKADGKAAVVLPDNVLFEGGAGEKVRQSLLTKTDLHTILRLPTGIFYKQGVKANVLFFDNKPGAKKPWTKEVWYYDFRTNVHFTLKQNPMKKRDLQDFINCYNPKNRNKRKETWSDRNPEGRWRKFTYDELIARDKTSLDIFWIKDESLTDLDNLPDPDILASEIVENLEAGLESFREIIATLEQSDM